jgi:ribosomal protein S18 acetylase RimI-like enzyme
VITALVRPARPEDHQQISNLIYYEPRLHRHLDWRSPLDWLGAPFYWALDDGQQITAALACPPEVEGIAWVRLFVYSGSWSAEDAWQVLWHTARTEIARQGGARVAVIAMQTWFQQILAAGGFETRQSIVMLEWQYQPWGARAAQDVRIRKMTEADLLEVTRVDAAAFDPLWQNSLETLRKAYSQSLIATVAETSAGLIGYQLSTGGGQRAHLARLAVSPAVQGRGVGRALVNDLFATLAHNGVYKLSVNTQSDNEASLRLYRHMGFLRTGEQYPVYTCTVPAYL